MKKRVIIYGLNYYPPRGGTSRVVENLILQLKDKYELVICCYKNPLAKDHIAGVRVVEFRKVAKGSLGSLIYFFTSALYILFRGKADLVHAHKTDCALFLPILKLRFKIVATSHEAPYRRDKWNALQRVYFRLAERIFIKSADCCTSISKPLAEYYQNKYQRTVIFIPNGINITVPEEFDYKKAESSLPAGATMRQPYLLFSARRLMSTKGCHTMLEALKKIDYKGQVFIAGELEESSYLEKLKGLSKGLNVFFLGYVDPLNVLLALVASSQFFIFPSETEGMSIMLLEVASVGRPVIASDIPENTQVFSEKEVLYFKCRDTDDLAAKIIFALSHRDQMVQLGQQAQAHVFAHYLWADIAGDYDLLYQNIIQ